MSHPTPDPAYALPTIHHNGTGVQTLADEYRALWRAAEGALQALVYATCNARDFYTQEPSAWDRARQEREEAFRKLTEVRAYARAWMAAAAEGSDPLTL